MAVNYNGSTWQISSSFPVSGYPLTISAWLRKTSNALRGAVSVFSTSDTSRFYIGTNSSGIPLLSVTTTSGTTQSATGASVAPDSIWFHVTGVFTASNLRVLYVNGIQDGINTNTRTVSAMDSLIFGGIRTTSNNSGNRWIGDVAEVCIFSSALSAADVLSLYAGGPRALPASNLILWDRMLDVSRKDIVRRTSISFSSGTNTTTVSHPRAF